MKVFHPDYILKGMGGLEFNPVEMKKYLDHGFDVAKKVYVCIVKRELVQVTRIGVDAHADVAVLALGQLELGVVRFKTEEEFIFLSVFQKALDIKDRMIGLWQTVQGEHAEHRRKSGEQDRHFEGHDDERRP